MRRAVEKDRYVVGIYSPRRDTSHVVEGLIAAWMIDNVLLENGVYVVDVGVSNEQLRTALSLVETLQPILIHVRVAPSDARLPRDGKIASLHVLMIK